MVNLPDRIKFILLLSVKKLSHLDLSSRSSWFIKIITLKRDTYFDFSNTYESHNIFPFLNKPFPSQNYFKITITFSRWHRVF